jgi:hypothetical protein
MGFCNMGFVQAVLSVPFSAAAFVKAGCLRFGRGASAGNDLRQVTGYIAFAPV